jgi:hypothetical protein
VSDLSDTRPERWWVLNPEAHRAFYCGRCHYTPIDRSSNTPMLNGTPLCAACAGQVLTGTPITAEYARWIDEGDPRWWSAWLCNCQFCRALEALS